MPTSVVRRRAALLIVLAVALANAAFAGLGSVFDYPDTDLANFVGYIVWSIWLLALATLIWRRTDRFADPAAPPLRQQASV
jgi:hypothetical protein